LVCRHFPEIATKFGYNELKPITDLLERGDYHTLSAAWSVMALKSYAGLTKDMGVKAGISVVTDLGIQRLGEPVAGLSRASLEPRASAVRFTLHRPAEAGQLGAWYQIIQTGFTQNAPEKAAGSTLEVVREILSDKGQPTSQAKVGETLLVKTTVRNVGETKQPNLALIEMLPGAFDFAPVGQSMALRPGRAALPGADYVDVREDRAVAYFDLEAQRSVSFTYSVRPTCAGSFRVPPSHAESMYDRAVSGHSASAFFTVLPRE
jgi:hypothetical protein